MVRDSRERRRVLFWDAGEPACEHAIGKRLMHGCGRGATYAGYLQNGPLAGSPLLAGRDGEPVMGWRARASLAGCLTLCLRRGRILLA